MARTATAQWELASALRDFQQSSARIWDYDTIHVTWDMAGEIQVSLNEGINYLAEGNQSVAIANLSSCIEKMPDLAAAYYYRSIAHKQLRNLGAAEFDMKNALRLNPLLYEGHIELGKLALIQKNTQKAEESLDRAIQIDPTRHTAYYLKGSLFLTQDRYAKAKQALRKSIEVNPTFCDAKIQEGIIAIAETNKPDAGLKFFNEVLEIDSLHTFGRLLRAITYDQGNLLEAIKDLDMIVRRNPSNTFFRAIRGTKLAEVGSYERSFNDLHFVIQSTYENENRFVGQQTWLDKRIDIQYAGYYTISQVYGLSESDQKKIKESYCLLLIGEYQKAIDAISLSSVADNSALALFLKAVAHEHMGKHPAAFELYARALALDNEILDAHKKKGIYNTELKMWREAEKEFNEMLRINGQAFVAYKLRGVARYYQNNFQGSIDDFTTFIKYDSSDFEVFRYRGIAHKAKGDEIHAALDFIESNDANSIDFKKLKTQLSKMMNENDTVTLMAYLTAITTAVPRFTYGVALRTRLLIEQAKWDLAYEAARSSIGIMQVGADKEFSYLLSIHAHELFSTSKFKEAAKVSEQAIKYDEENGLAHLINGKSLIELNKEKDALKSLKIAERLGERDATPLRKRLEQH